MLVAFNSNQVVIRFAWSIEQDVAERSCFFFVRFVGNTRQSISNTISGVDDCIVFGGG
jgi:hypothetical protein